MDETLTFNKSTELQKEEEQEMAKIVDFPGISAAKRKPILLKVPANAGCGRRTNAEIGRNRDHLTPIEVKSLVDAAGRIGRHTLRDKALILIAYRHGLRVSEATNLRWDQVDFAAARLHVNRLKGGTAATHPIEGDELRMLRRLRRAYPDSPFVFTTERGGPLTRSAVNKIVARAGQLANILFPVTPHQLRHACGYFLANRGIPTRTIQAYLGHSNISNTQRYTALSDAAFKNLWS